MKKRQLIAAAFGVLCAANTMVQADLVAHYPFNGNYNDTSGNGHHATHSGGLGSVVNDVERGRVFDTKNSSYLNIEGTVALPHFPANSSITLMAWAKQSENPGSDYAYILQLGKNGDHAVASLGIQQDGRVLSYCETSQPGMNLDQVTSRSDRAVEAGDAWADWHHLAVVYDRTVDVATFYVDGVVAGANDISDLNDTYAFNWPQGRIGGDFNGSPYFRGAIDDVRIYDEALSAKRILAVFSKGVERWSDFGTTPNPPATPGAQNPNGLTAYVFETSDSFTSHVGAGESLRRAGFHVQPLPLNRPPFKMADDPGTDVDLILFGSFVSERPAYQAYMDVYGDVLDDYIERGGYVVQLTQADQDEIQPPFLPARQNAARSDTDFPAAVILSPNHTMIQGFPRNVGGKVAFTLPFHTAPVVWESFTSFSGFEVILAGDDRAKFPALMEGAHGQGRLLLAAMAPDKILDAANGVEQRGANYMRFNQKFFENLYTQTRKVRDRVAAPLNITPPPVRTEIVDGAWTIAILPDTQKYARKNPGVFSAQTIWLRDNARTFNIRYVLHLGDIVDNNNQEQWRAARESMGVMDGYLPYAFAPGNHDYGPNGNAKTRDTLMNNHFLFNDYSARPHFGGAMQRGKMDNTYHLFEAGGYEWIVMCLEWGPRDSTIAWAHSVLRNYPNRKAILVTHVYMNNNDLRYDISDTVNSQLYNPHNYNTEGGVNDGEELWQKLVRRHNFVLTVNGHVLGDGTGFRTDANDAGQNVHQMLANYQLRQPFGGNGYLRLLTVNPDGTVDVKSYSPLYNQELSEADQAFTFDFEWYAPADANGNGQFDYVDHDLDSDGDGLSNYREFAVLGTDPFNTDSDGDGLSDRDELAIGTDPAVSNKATADAIIGNARVFDLCSEPDIFDLNIGLPLIEAERGNFNLSLQLEGTDDLRHSPFRPIGEPVQWTLENPAGRQFLRVRAE